jgi:hypothetical protein
MFVQVWSMAKTAILGNVLLPCLKQNYSPLHHGQVSFKYQNRRIIPLNKKAMYIYSFFLVLKRCYYRQLSNIQKDYL